MKVGLSESMVPSGRAIIVLIFNVVMCQCLLCQCIDVLGFFVPHAYKMGKICFGGLSKGG